MTEEEKQKLKESLYNNHWIGNPENADPMVSIWFSDLVDLLEDYKNTGL